MREEEAKTKWCPFARELDIQPRAISEPGQDGVVIMSGFNRAGDSGSLDSKCLGHECMAWRWREIYIPAPKQEGRVLPLRGHTEISKTEGYCGLAGKP